MPRYLAYSDYLVSVGSSTKVTSYVMRRIALASSARYGTGLVTLGDSQLNSGFSEASCLSVAAEGPLPSVLPAARTVLGSLCEVPTWAPVRTPRSPLWFFHHILTNLS